MLTAEPSPLSVVLVLTAKVNVVRLRRGVSQKHGVIQDLLHYLNVNGEAVDIHSHEEARLSCTSSNACWMPTLVLADDSRKIIPLLRAHSSASLRSISLSYKPCNEWRM